MTSMIAALQRLVTGTSEAAPAKSQRSGHPVISGLYVYPVKSCHAISVQEAAVKPCGAPGGCLTKSARARTRLLLS